MIQIVREEIDIPAVLQSVSDPAAGGVDIFIGTTRNHAHGRRVIALEYEAYEPMALEKMKQISDEVKEKWKISRISIVHRIGRLEIGQASIVIAVSAAHRNEAFKACGYAIDRLKRTVPIWKKEFFEDGAVWVGMEGEEPLHIDALP